MKYASVAALAGAIMVAAVGAAQAGDPESCKGLRFSDVGWTDITATTSIAAEIFKGLGAITHPFFERGFDFRPDRSW